eukprot:1160646-Pelagomonas_calceolata.AAC.7
MEGPGCTAEQQGEGMQLVSIRAGKALQGETIVLLTCQPSMKKKVNVISRDNCAPHLSAIHEKETECNQPRCVGREAGDPRKDGIAVADASRQRSACGLKKPCRAKRSCPSRATSGDEAQPQAVLYSGLSCDCVCVCARQQGAHAGTPNLSLVHWAVVDAQMLDRDRCMGMQWVRHVAHVRKRVQPCDI